eukprot:scaffold2272_cov297-Prasinococcus_capsulatus_cf.AAC.3
MPHAVVHRLACAPVTQPRRAAARGAQSSAPPPRGRASRDPRARARARLRRHDMHALALPRFERRARRALHVVS